MGYVDTSDLPSRKQTMGCYWTVGTVGYVCMWIQASLPIPNVQAEKAGVPAAREREGAIN